MQSPFLVNDQDEGQQQYKSALYAIEHDQSLDIPLLCARALLEGKDKRVDQALDVCTRILQSIDRKISMEQEAKKIVLQRFKEFGGVEYRDEGKEVEEARHLWKLVFPVCQLIVDCVSEACTERDQIGKIIERFRFTCDFFVQIVFGSGKSELPSEIEKMILVQVYLGSDSHQFPELFSFALSKYFELTRRKQTSEIVDLWIEVMQWFPLNISFQNLNFGYIRMFLDEQNRILGNIALKVDQSSVRIKLLVYMLDQFSRFLKEGLILTSALDSFFPLIRTISESEAPYFLHFLSELFVHCNNDSFASTNLQLIEPIVKCINSLLSRLSLLHSNNDFVNLSCSACRFSYLIAMPYYQNQKGISKSLVDGMSLSSSILLKEESSHKHNIESESTFLAFRDFAVTFKGFSFLLSAVQNAALVSFEIENNNMFELNLLSIGSLLESSRYSKERKLSLLDMLLKNPSLSYSRLQPYLLSLITNSEDSTIILTCLEILVESVQFYLEKMHTHFATPIINLLFSFCRDEDPFVKACGIRYLGRLFVIQCLAAAKSKSLVLIRNALLEEFHKLLNIPDDAFLILPNVSCFVVISQICENVPFEGMDLIVFLQAGLKKSSSTLIQSLVLQSLNFLLGNGCLDFRAIFLHLKEDLSLFLHPNKIIPAFVDFMGNWLWYDGDDIFYRITFVFDYLLEIVIYSSHIEAKSLAMKYVAEFLAENMRSPAELENEEYAAILKVLDDKKLKDYIIRDLLENDKSISHQLINLLKVLLWIEKFSKPVQSLESNSMAADELKWKEEPISIQKTKNAIVSSTLNFPFLHGKSLRPPFKRALGGAILFTIVNQDMKSLTSELLATFDDRPKSLYWILCGAFLNAWKKYVPSLIHTEYKKFRSKFQGNVQDEDIHRVFISELVSEVQGKFSNSTPLVHRNSEFLKCIISSYSVHVYQDYSLFNANWSYYVREMSKSELNAVSVMLFGFLSSSLHPTDEDNLLKSVDTLLKTVKEHSFDDEICIASLYSLATLVESFDFSMDTNKGNCLGTRRKALKTFTELLISFILTRAIDVDIFSERQTFKNMYSDFELIDLTKIKSKNIIAAVLLSLSNILEVLVKVAFFDVIANIYVILTKVLQSWKKTWDFGVSISLHLCHTKVMQILVFHKIAPFSLIQNSFKSIAKSLSNVAAATLDTSSYGRLSAGFSLVRFCMKQNEQIELCNDMLSILKSLIDKKLKPESHYLPLMFEILFGGNILSSADESLLFSVSQQKNELVELVISIINQYLSKTEDELDENLFDEDISSLQFWVLGSCSSYISQEFAAKKSSGSNLNISEAGILTGELCSFLNRGLVSGQECKMNLCLEAVNLSSGLRPVFLSNRRDSSFVRSMKDKKSIAKLLEISSIKKILEYPQFDLKLNSLRLLSYLASEGEIISMKYLESLLSDRFFTFEDNLQDEIIVSALPSLVCSPNFTKGFEIIEGLFKMAYTQANSRVPSRIRISLLKSIESILLFCKLSSQNDYFLKLKTSTLRAVKQFCIEFYYVQHLNSSDHAYCLMKNPCDSCLAILQLSKCFLHAVDPFSMNTAIPVPSNENWWKYSDLRLCLSSVSSLVDQEKEVFICMKSFISLQETQLTVLTYLSQRIVGVLQTITDFGSQIRCVEELLDYLCASLSQSKTHISESIVWIICKIIPLWCIPGLLIAHSSHEIGYFFNQWMNRTRCDIVNSSSLYKKIVQVFHVSFNHQASKFFAKQLLQSRLFFSELYFQDQTQSRLFMQSI